MKLNKYNGSLFIIFIINKFTNRIKSNKIKDNPSLIDPMVN